MAAGCVRLGFWQLSRLHQRRARNAIVSSHLDSAEVDVRALPRDSLAARQRPDIDTAVLVNRGWVYAPDGATVDQTRWREADTTFRGFVEEMPATHGSAYASRPNVISRLGYDVVARALPYPVAPFVVVVLGDSVMRPDKIARLTVPPLDEGPHMSYAIQWFGFAAVALIGAGIVITQSRRASGESRFDDDAAAPD